MNNSLLAGTTATPPPRRPMSAGANGHRSTERFADLRKSLASLQDTMHQRTGVGSSTADMAVALGASSSGTPSRIPMGPPGGTMTPAARFGAASSRGAGPADSEQGWKEVKENSARLQQHIALEVRRRAEGQKALQQLVDARAKEIAQVVEQKVTERMIALHKTIDGLTKRVDVLGRELAVEREKNVRLTQELKFQATQGLSEVKNALEQERAQRVEKEAMLGRKLSEDVFRLQERLDVERHARDTMVATVREELAGVAKQRHKADAQLVQGLLEDIKATKAQLAAERNEREQGEEHLAAALNDVVRQVKAGLAAMA
jgi:hypothetical protein